MEFRNNWKDYTHAHTQLNISRINNLLYGTCWHAMVCNCPTYPWTVWSRCEN